VTRLPEADQGSLPCAMHACVQMYHGRFVVVVQEVASRSSGLQPRTHCCEFATNE
jgi:hypothetical protein